MSRSARSILGFSPIDIDVLKKSAENVKRWLNFHVLSSGISNYPNDVIAQNGRQIHELILHLTGRKVGKGVLKLDDKLNRNERVELIRQQYVDVIKFLKQNGAYLNTIRPEFLLSLPQYNLWIKNNQPLHCLEKHLKLNDAKHSYLSVNSWVTIFYQSIKVFYLA